jgi:hypothetical protein
VLSSLAMDTHASLCILNVESFLMHLNVARCLSSIIELYNL